eukprot:m.75340 g.75340  ORF g.75340 m.75340 type:complete len:54 (+) comp20507_c0_seq5:149-310(+)
MLSVIPLCVFAQAPVVCLSPLKEFPHLEVTFVLQLGGQDCHHVEDLAKHFELF